LSEDPAFLDLGDAKFSDSYGRSLADHLSNPQSLNSYSYANNNPIIYRDPDGRILPIILGALVAYGWASLAIQAYDAKTVLIDHPEVFTTEQKNAARDSLALGAIMTVAGFGSEKYAATIGPEAVQLSNGLFGILGVGQDAESVLHPKQDASKGSGQETRSTQNNGNNSVPNSNGSTTSLGNRSSSATNSRNTPSQTVARPNSGTSSNQCSQSTPVYGPKRPTLATP
jgi:hypothetical protein